MITKRYDNENIFMIANFKMSGVISFQNVLSNSFNLFFSFLEKKKRSAISPGHGCRISAPEANNVGP